MLARPSFIDLAHLPLPPSTIVQAFVWLNVQSGPNTPDSKSSWIEPYDKTKMSERLNIPLVKSYATSNVVPGSMLSSIVYPTVIESVSPPSTTSSAVNVSGLNTRSGEQLVTVNVPP